MWHVDNSGEKNPSYKGNDAGYDAIHAWVRRRKQKPDLCEECELVPPRDLANQSGQYLRDLSDWKYLCRKCHMDGDGRNAGLAESGKLRKLPAKKCSNCGAEFHRDSRDAKFCSRKCYLKSRVGIITNPEGINRKGKVRESNLANF